MTLTPEETIRYSRHLVLREFGFENQLRIKQAKVLVVGAGGLGCPVLQYLTAAGVGSIGIVDADKIELSNLQRQVLYSVDDIGKSKAEVAAGKLRRQNPSITINSFDIRLTSRNVFDIAQSYEIIIDCTDNFPTRYLLNDVCVLQGKPMVYGSILRFEGQVSVFNFRKADGSFSSNYRDLFPQPPDPSMIQNCEEAGVLGVLPGMIGCMQAGEALKILTGLGEPLVDRLLILDTMSLEQHIIRIRNQNAAREIKGLIDYEEFCGISRNKNKSLNSNNHLGMKEVTVQELKSMLDSKEDFQLIDVREPHEYDICNLGGELIPQGEIPGSVDRISKDKKVVIHCRSGARSGNMVQWLEKNHNFTNLYNLKGGVLAWAREIDPSMPTY